MIRLGTSSERQDEVAERPAIVEPKQKPRTTIFGAVPDSDPEEHRRRGEAADALWRELVRRAAGDA